MPSMYASYTPRQQSRTSRNDIKRRIRQKLGTQSDGAPSTRRTLEAARDMAELLYLATDGKLRLELKDAGGNRLDFLTAIGAADTDNRS